LQTLIVGTAANAANSLQDGHSFARLDVSAKLIPAGAVSEEFNGIPYLK
jgi:Zn-dependent M16 (insulinase) family peptidase